MSCCPPTCVPTCVPSCSRPVCYPVGCLGSLTSCGGGSSGLSYGISSGGGAVSAASLGIAPGASVSCLNQIPPSEVHIQPAPVAVLIPGPILAASCEPARVGGYTACASVSSGSKVRYLSCNPCSPCQ